ncbi:MAG: hypothetical protein D5R97_07505 [Candidatus Syntrophonatronum acetioxidans]|uniref:DUF7305 domain-containing protein n=1 Tax=Candidatus Syntrophonatronum acetioxidans TaxID=1795816 RepID=A0A424YBT2_9FIRM|nr:MAG: hypothetical protein D5R97_07505 [Candidatus Syntrophonatronum acetioxidans]
MKLLRDERGLALPLVLVVLIVVSLLGIALFNYSTSELTHSVREEKKARAHYIARAGAESLARHIMEDMVILDEVKNIGDKIVFDEQDFTVVYHGLEEKEEEKVGDLLVELERITDYRVEVTGIGTVDEVSQRVKILLETQEKFDGVIYSLGSLDFQRSINEISGDIYSGGEVKFGGETVEEDKWDNHSQVNGIIRPGVKITFPPPEFPDEPASYEGDFILSNNTSDTIEHDPSENKQALNMINIKNGAELTIDANKGDVFVEAEKLDMDPNGKLLLKTSSIHDLTLVVNDAELSEVEVKGSGTARLYVRSEANLQTPHGVVTIEDGANLLVFLDQDAIMELRANSHFKGLIYGPEATVEMGSNANFTGSMTVNQLKGTGGSSEIGEAQTDIKQEYSWDLLDDIDVGGYYMVRWS